LNRGFRIERKTVLFQCKKEWHHDALLLSQCIKLSTWREAAFVLNYTPQSFDAFALDDVIRSRGKKEANIGSKLLSQVLGHDFPDCVIGDTDLFYDATAKKLIWRAAKGEIVSTSFTVGHRVRVEVTTPHHEAGVKGIKMFRIVRYMPIA